MSFLTPVYLAGTLKGIVMVDVNRDNLKIFLYRDRPLVWRYLNVTLKDMDSGKEIIINQSKNNLFQYVNYSHDILVGCAFRCPLILPISLSRLGRRWPLLTGNGAPA